MSIRQGLKISLSYVIFSCGGCGGNSGWVCSTMLALGLSRMAAMHFSQAVSPSQTACEVPVVPLNCLLHTHCFWASLCRLIPALKLWFRQAWQSRVCAGGMEGVDACAWLHSTRLWVYERLSESMDDNEILSGSRDSIGCYRILALLALEENSVCDTTCYVRWDRER